MTGRSLVLVLGSLVACSTAVAGLSHEFSFSTSQAGHSIEFLVAFMTVGGVLYLLALRALRVLPSGRGRLLLVLGAGLLLRVVMFASTPALEDDHYRYLWDGAVASRGLDPYAFSPAEVLDADSPVPGRLRDLGVEGEETLRRVNYPALRTIYPPIAQVAFAAAHRVAPWRLLGLRLVWLVLDLSALLLLAWATRGSETRVWKLGVYWLNPLLVKEIYNSGHMELVVMVPALMAQVLAGRRRPLSSALALAIGVGAKLWPGLWLPLLLRAAGRRRTAIGVALLVVGLAAAILWPMLADAGHVGSGLLAYSGHWQMNDSAFVVIQWVAEMVAGERAPQIARAVVVVVVLMVAAASARRPIAGEADLYRRALIVVATLFLLSPTQYPWYYLWLLPLLALRPRASLLSLTATLPLYYLRFRMAPAGLANWFDYGVVWLEFAPAWILLILEWRQSRRETLRVGEAPEEGPWIPAPSSR